MLNYEFPPIGGGAGHAHLNLVRQFSHRSDISIDVLTSGLTPGLSIEKYSENITIRKIGIKKKNLHYWKKSEILYWLFRARSQYDRMLRTNKYDLVHAFFAFPSGWLCYRSRRSLPYILSLRGSDVPGYNVRLGLDYKILAGLFRRIWKNAASIVANSIGLKNLALQFLPELQIDVIPNGVDPTRYTAPDRRTLHQPPRLLTVGRLIRRKRIDLLIKTVAHLKNKNILTHLNIVGDGNLLSELRDLTRKLDITDRVTFLGYVPQEKLPQLYRDNDIYLMSSHHEGMSNAMLEALAAAMPIITTPCEGANELVKDNGIIVHAPSPEPLAQAVCRLIDHPDLYQQQVRAARRHVQFFSWKSVAQQYYNLYKNVMNLK